MAVAIHMGQVKKMDYAFKSFDVKKWRFYEAWMVLKVAPKFALRRYATTPSNGGGTADGSMENPEAVGDANGGISRQSSRGGPGRGKSKAALYQEETVKKRQVAMTGIDDKLGQLAQLGKERLHEQKKARKLMAVRCALSHYKSVDPEKAKELAEQLLELMKDDEEAPTPTPNTANPATANPAMANPVTTNSNTANTANSTNMTMFANITNV